MSWGLGTEALGVSQPTAWRMGHVLRLMVARENMLAGTVENRSFPSRRKAWGFRGRQTPTVAIQRRRRWSGRFREGQERPARTGNSRSRRSATYDFRHTHIPRPVAPPARHFADAEIGDEAERRTLRDLQLGRDQSGRHHRPRQVGSAASTQKRSLGTSAKTSKGRSVAKRPRGMDNILKTGLRSGPAR